MPSKKKSRKMFEDFKAALVSFKANGTGSHIEHQLLREFPLFSGKAPPGHPYPQAFKDGTDDEKWCYIEAIDDMVLLRRKLPSGRVISIDTCDFALLNGGTGVAHINMDNGDNRVANLKNVREPEARKMLLEFTENGDVSAVYGKPLTIDEKINALISLPEAPKPGDMMSWPNGDGIQVPFAPFDFWESIQDNWKP